jgi:hypothetical protein
VAVVLVLQAVQTEIDLLLQTDQVLYFLQLHQLAAAAVQHIEQQLLLQLILEVQVVAVAQMILSKVLRVLGLQVKVLQGVLGVLQVAHLIMLAVAAVLVLLVAQELLVVLLRVQEVLVFNLQ